MSTTSLKLPEALKRRTAALAQRRGTTPHAFMVEAISAAADAAERREVFVAAAKTARRSALRTGKGLDADEVHAYLRRRVASGKATPPKARSWRG